MGIPKFARWISQKYPEMVNKTPPTSVAGLYIDMNGIIHPCCHSEDDPSVALRTVEEKIEAVCEAVDELVTIMQPTNVVYLAMDGVAPRAKMNQQRARRYSSAASAVGAQHPMDHFTQDEAEKAVKELRAAESEIDFGIFGAPKFDEKHAEMCSPPTSPTGRQPTISSPKSDLFGPVGGFGSDLFTMDIGSAPAATKETKVSFDSNCISPGTDFMTKCADRLRTWIKSKIDSENARDAHWKTRLVILSDTNTPGEGEHKFIDFLRTQISAQSGVVQGTGAHVVVALDADLILLCLSLHNSNVYIMRDRKRALGSGGKEGKRLSIAAAAGGMEERSESNLEALMDREETNSTGTGGGMATPSKAAPFPATADTSPVPSERATTSSRGVKLAVDSATGKALPFGSTAAAYVAEKLKKYEFYNMAAAGDGIVSEVLALAGSENITGLSLKLADCEGGGPRIIEDFITMATVLGNDFIPRLPGSFCGESAMDNLLEIYVRDVLPFGSLTTKDGDVDVTSLYRLMKGLAEVEVMRFRQQRIRMGKLSDRDAGAALWSRESEAIDGPWRDLYYSTTTINKANLNKACEVYVDGLRFVKQYYSKTSKEVAWRWFYPYHHAPLAMDVAMFLRPLPKLRPIPVTSVAPSPYAQLMCILPPASHALLPEPYHNVLLHPEPKLKDTFPQEWTVDATAAGGKDHLCVPLLPFANLDELERLDSELQLEHDMELTAEEHRRGRNNYYHEIFLSADALLSIQETLTPPGGSPASTGPAVAASQIAVAPTPAPTATKPEPKNRKSKGATNSGAHNNSNEPRKNRSLFLFGKITEFTKSPLTSGSCRVLRFEEEVVPQSQSRAKPRTYNSALKILNLTIGKADHQKVKRAARAATKAAGGAAGRAIEVSIDNTALGKGTPIASIAVAAIGAVTLTHLFGSFKRGEFFSWYLPVEFPFFVSIGMTVLWFLNMLGIAGFAQWDRPVLLRNNIRETNVDWQCPDCLSINFSRQQCCYRCQFPYSAAKCRAVYSSTIPTSPPLYEPDHTISCERVCLKPITK